MGDYEMVSTNPTTDLNPNGEMAKRPLINGDTEKAHVNASFLKKNLLTHSYPNLPGFYDIIGHVKNWRIPLHIFD